MAEKETSYNVESELAKARLEAEKYERNIQKDAEGLYDADEKEAIKRRMDLVKILRTVEGRRLLYRLLEIGGPYKPSYDPVSSRQTDYNEGRRSVGTELLKLIMEADPGAYVQMLNEHASDIKSYLERKRKEEKEKTQ